MPVGHSFIIGFIIGANGLTVNPLEEKNNLYFCQKGLTSWPLKCTGTKSGGGFGAGTGPKVLAATGRLAASSGARAYP
jgi:hypothetical protein